MKKILFAAAALFVGTQAQALQVEECEGSFKSHITNVMTPVEGNVKSYYGGDVSIFNIDYMEPAACSAGLVVTMPDSNGETGMEMACFVVSCAGAIDINNAQSSYDPNRGLLLSIPYGMYNPETGHIDLEDEVLKLRINRATSTLALEE